MSTGREETLAERQKKWFRETILKDNDTELARRQVAHICAEIDRAHGVKPEPEEKR